MPADRRLKDRYTMQRLPLAHRGMGQVWRGYDTLLKRDVVIKFIDPGHVDAKQVHRFRREALLTARLTHPGVPAIFDLGELDGRPYLVLEWIDGHTLRDVIDEQDVLPIPWVYCIGAQISGVLIAAWQLDLVHRDMKPSNVILERSGTVKVLDFGLAVIHDDRRYSRITETGESLGTVGYMAPEQVHGEPTDHRTDLYGLGGTLFHLLTGAAPFDDDTTRATLARQIGGPAPRPSLLRPDIPDALDDLVHALLAVDPADRPANAAEVYRALAPHLTAPPPMPGVVNDDLDPVRAYAAAAGHQPLRVPSTLPVALAARSVEFDAEKIAAEARRLVAGGEFRAAARLWRQLADHHEREHGPDHSTVIDYRLCVADAHLALGEPDRALRLVDQLAAQAHAAGTEYPRIDRLRQDIERSTAVRAAAHQRQSAPG